MVLVFEQSDQATVVRGTAKVDGANLVLWCRTRSNGKQTVSTLQLCGIVRSESGSAY
jgi:hypothetical protein